MNGFHVIEVAGKPIATAFVRVDADYPPGSTWILSIDVELAQRGDGWGTELMKQICAEADEEGRELWLAAIDDRLVKWYERFGFKPWRYGSNVMTRERADVK